jgi:Sortase (surface protein transpeptidase)
MKHKTKVILTTVAGVAVIGGAGLGVAQWQYHSSLKTTAVQVKQAKTKIVANKDLTKTQEQTSVKYGNSGGGLNIPNSATLKKYANSSEIVYGRGYVAVPAQKGVTQPISSLAINEGSSNKVLAIGAGTVQPGAVMGQGNFTIAAHNFGNNVTYFSPMQNSIDVDATPKAYLTDGKKIYVYQFNKTTDDVSGRRVVSYKKGSVANVNNTLDGKAMLTMITCDEPGIFTLHPDNRLVLTGHLVSEHSVDKATASEEALFPQVF